MEETEETGEKECNEILQVKRKRRGMTCVDKFIMTFVDVCVDNFVAIVTALVIVGGIVGVVKEYYQKLHPVPPYIHESDFHSTGL